MDTQLTTTHWGLLPSGFLAVALLATLGATTTTAASPAACSVKNTDTGKTYTRLQSAVDAAKPGARLVVKGTCHGGTFIDKSLAIAGTKAKRNGQTMLDGDGTARVLTIRPGVKVSLRDLVVRDGTARRVPNGGGISNKGRLALHDVIVKGNRASTGAGIYNAGVMWMKGSSRVKANWGTGGTGAYNAGTLTMDDASSISFNGGWGNSSAVVNVGSMTMNGSSSIHDNIFSMDPRVRAVQGGGVYNAGDLTMNDQSSIHDNQAADSMSPKLSPIPPDKPTARGGGVYNTGTVTMNGLSRVFGNRAIAGSGPSPGGGIYSAAGAFLVGVICGTGGNVSGNTPDDCHIEP